MRRTGKGTCAWTSWSAGWRDWRLAKGKATGPDEVRSLYAGPLFWARSGVAESRGYSQDSPLSPYLVNIAISSLWNGVRVAAVDRGLRRGLWDLDFWELLHADDTAFKAETEDVAKGLLGILEKEAAEVGLRLNRTKSEALTLRLWRCTSRAGTNKQKIAAAAEHS